MTDGQGMDKLLQWSEPAFGPGTETTGEGTGIPEPKIQKYLDAVKARLNTVTPGERQAIADEIYERICGLLGEIGATVESVLGKLGPPEKLAVKCRDARLIAKANESYLPPVLLHALLRSGIQGVFAFVVGLIGYWCGGGLIAFGAVLVMFSKVLRSSANQSTAGGALGMIGVGVLILFLTTIGLRFMLGFIRRQQPTPL